MISKKEEERILSLLIEVEKSLSNVEGDLLAKIWSPLVEEGITPSNIEMVIDNLRDYNHTFVKREGEEDDGVDFISVQNLRMPISKIDTFSSFEEVGVGGELVYGIIFNEDPSEFSGTTNKRVTFTSFEQREIALLKIDSLLNVKSI